MQRKMASPLPHVPIDKPGSSNGDQEAKKLHQMSSFAREFYDIDKPESSNGYQEDKKFNKMGSFAREFYSSHGSGDEGDRLVEPDECGDVQRVARAKHRMAYATDSQWAVLEQELGAELGGGGGGGMVLDKVLAWRKKRGDFNDDDDDDETGAFYGDVEVPQLPSDMKDVCENTLNLGFLKSDLQFECLLLNIPYAGSDSKPQLISKLMHYKDTLFLDANSFDILQRQCRDDDAGILDDALKSDCAYLTDSQGADLEEEFMRAPVGEGKGGAGPSLVDAWGRFHYADDDDDEEDEADYYDDDDEDED